MEIAPFHRIRDLVPAYTDVINVEMHSHLMWMQGHD